MAVVKSKKAPAKKASAQLPPKPIKIKAAVKSKSKPHHARPTVSVVMPRGMGAARAR